MNAIQRLRTWHAPPPLGPALLALVTAAGLFGVFWGILFPVKIDVVNFDAGPLSQFAVHRVVAYPEQSLYLVGMDNGSIRAIDGRVESDGCRVTWRPDDPRGSARNPQGLPGVFEDPCNHAIWSFEGNAIAGANQPLRTPHVQGGSRADGPNAHVLVELINPTK